MNLLKKHWIISLLILCILLTLLFILGETSFKTTFTEVAQYIPPPQTQTAAVGDFNGNLVARWAFDEGSGTSAADSSGNGNTGTVANGALWESGKVGSGALALDGTNDHVNAGSASSLDDLAQFSISFWAKADSAGGGSLGRYISKNSNSGGGSGWAVYNQLNRITFLANFSGTDLEVQSGWNSLSTGAWTHWMITWDGSADAQNVHIYKNGVETGYNLKTNAVGSRVSDASRSVVIGGDGEATDRYFDGAIDDVRIYNRVLASDVISDFYTFNETTSPSSPPPATPPPAEEPPPSSVTTYTLTVNRSGTGSGTVTASGISCGSDCIETVNTGTSFTLSATANSGSTFAGWSGGGCSGTNTCNVTLNANTTVTASFDQPVLAANSTWYVDNSATGASTGRSWADAWPSFTSIVWGTSGVKAGDTLYISGGASSKTYPSGYLSIGASGTPGKPITIRVGQEPGHNGLAVVSGIGIGTRQYIVIDGARNSSFVPPTNVWNIEQIKSNIGIRVTSPTDAGIFINSTGGEHNKIRYVEVGPIGTTANVGDIHGIRFLNLTAISDWLIEYVWIHDIQNDGINMNSSTNNPESWDALKVRWALIERTGDDGVQIVRNGFTLENSFLRDHWLALYNGHPDHVQFSGVSSRYLKVVNNIISNKANSLIIGEHYVTEGGQLGPMLIAGNLFYNTRDWPYTDPTNPATRTGGQAYGVTFDAWRPNTDISINNATWTGFHFLNNTMYYQRTTPIKVGRARPDGATRSAKRIDFTNSSVRNNLVIESAWNASAASPFIVDGSPVGTDPTNGIFYDTTSFPMTHNIVTGSNKKISWGGVIYPTGEEMTTRTGLPGNSSAMPTLASITGYDFRLSATDTAARDKGFNISALVSQFPELATDLWGNRRGQGAGWDIGAYEYPGGGVAPVTPEEPPVVPTGGLKLHLNFNSDDFSAAGTSVAGITQRYFADLSGQGNRANCQVDFTKNGIQFNQCPLATTGPDGSRAAQFSGNTCRRDSDYLAIAKSASISDLTSGTIALWSTDANTLYHNDQIIDAFGQMQPNTWQIGEDGANYKVFTVNDDLGLETDLLSFPGETRPVNSWNHYAVTWGGSTVRGYWNGVLFQEMPMKRTSKFTIGNYLALSALMHGSNRNISDAGNCIEQYGGTAGQDYVFPNAGFMEGKIDDVRIYDRKLSDAEIRDLAVPSHVSGVYVVRVQKTGTGGGYISGNRNGGAGAEALSCGKRCAEAYPAGSTMTLTATPEVDSVFAGWSGACSGTGQCNISALNNHQSVTAHFTQAYPVVASFEAESGIITSPFVTSGGVLRQPNTTSALLSGGRAEYTFTVPEAGTYLISAQVSIPSAGSNSLFVSVDAEPTDPDSIWHVYTTGGDEERFVTQGSNTSGNNPIKEFTLAAGTHKLIVRGRERNAVIDSWMIIKKGAGVVAATPTADFNGDGRVNSLDFSALSSNWNKNSPTHDLNKDGIVNTLDYSILIQQWTG